MGSQPRHVYVECGECEGCKVCRTLRTARPQETDYHATPCDCPSSVARTTPAPAPTQTTVKDLDGQVQRMLRTMHPAHCIAWLAGVRFALGHAEHGDTMQRWSDDRLAYEHAQEKADAFNYATEQAARKANT